MASVTNDDRRWLANVGGNNFGPYCRTDVERMIQRGQLLETDYLCVEGLSGWVEARNDPTFGQLFSYRVDVAALLPEAPSAISTARSIKIYYPKSRTQWRLTLVAFVLGAAGLIPLKHISGWFSGGPKPESGAVIAALCALFFLPLGILSLTNALRGLPRLTVTPQGLKLKGGIRTKEATWGSVEPFAIKNVYSGRFRQVHVASAKFVGSGAGRARNFVIQDHFTAPIEEIATELNAARARATGDAAPAAAGIASNETPIGLAQFKLPWLTFAILAVLIVVFALENMFPVTPAGKGLTPSIPTLVAFGASSHNLVLSSGQWFRLFTAPLLHANLPHIVGNAIALVWGGWLLERLVGRLWYFAFFVVGALGGSLCSIAVNPVNLVSVGVSGALMGLFAALFVGSFRHASGTAGRTRLQFSSMRILIPSLLPITSTSSLMHIDYGAHIGGALSGAALAIFLLKYWPESTRIPQLRRVAAAISTVGTLLFVASGGLAIANYPKVVRAVRTRAPSVSSSLGDILSDHGPKRVACDSKWSRLQQRDPPSYRQFLENCMKDSASP